jgi:hypothetical protein
MNKDPFHAGPHAVSRVYSLSILLPMYFSFIHAMPASATHRAVFTDGTVYKQSHYECTKQ